MREFDEAATESLQEYFKDISNRLVKNFGLHHVTSQAWFLAKSGEDHFVRFEMPYRRYFRALGAGDEISAAYERRVMLALLYEIAYTTYLAMNLLDLDKLELQSSADGFGLAGECAGDVIQIFSYLDVQCRRLLALERKTGLFVDFSSPIDEKEGLTFKTHRHWQDCVPGSVEESFSSYFERARRAILVRMNQKPRYWSHQTVRGYLQSKGYRALGEVLRRLEQATFKPRKTNAYDPERREGVAPAYQRHAQNER